jgi:outer membrane protein assembly factor BamE (lipoprotein component of BamABCDE complex)
MRARLALTWLAVLSCTACVGLHPRTTLEGRRFAAERVGEVRAGQTEAEVRALLGAPHESLRSGEDDLWRYYERFEPRGCEHPRPIVTKEFRVRFKAGIVVGTEPVARLGSAREPRCCRTIA